jgi:hypothetical protein
MCGPKTLLSFVLACASSVIASDQSQTTPPKPGPGPQVMKLAVMVGRFTVEDELKAGVMGPNSPALPAGVEGLACDQKAPEADDCGNNRDCR